jgi:hypothetical protein
MWAEDHQDLTEEHLLLNGDQKSWGHGSGAYLPSKYEALSSTPILKKKKRERAERGLEAPLPIAQGPGSPQDPLFSNQSTSVEVHKDGHRRSWAETSLLPRHQLAQPLGRSPRRGLQ